MPCPCSTWHIVYDRMDLAQGPIQLHYAPTKSMIMQGGLQFVGRVDILVLNVEHTYNFMDRNGPLRVKVVALATRRFCLPAKLLLECDEGTYTTTFPCDKPQYSHNHGAFTDKIPG